MATSPLGDQGKPGMSALRGGKADAMVHDPITDAVIDANDYNILSGSTLPGHMPTGGTHGSSTFRNLGL